MASWQEFYQRLVERFRIGTVRLIRRGQDRYYRGYHHHLDLYDVFEGGSFRDLYHALMNHLYADLYWFCIMNARYKQED